MKKVTKIVKKKFLETVVREIPTHCTQFHTIKTPIKLLNNIKRLSSTDIQNILLILIKDQRKRGEYRQLKAIRLKKSK